MSEILNKNEIQLWFVYDNEIYDSELIELYYSIINEEEAEQQKRFYFKKHQHQYLITRALVRSVLSLNVDGAIKPAEWIFNKNKYGKPYISNIDLNSPMYFNVSHTENMIVLAVASSSEVGVDAEWMLRTGKTIELSEHFFSPLEAKLLRSLPAEKQKEYFYDLWTLKEAYIKACGMGLSIPLDQFSYSFSKKNEISVSFDSIRNERSRQWNFWQIKPNSTHRVAVAIKNESMKERYQLGMKKIVPMKRVCDVNFPIFRQSLNT